MSLPTNYSLNNNTFYETTTHFIYKNNNNNNTLGRITINTKLFIFLITIVVLLIIIIIGVICWYILRQKQKDQQSISSREQRLTISAIEPTIPNLKNTERLTSSSNTSDNILAIALPNKNIANKSNEKLKSIKKDTIESLIMIEQPGSPTVPNENKVNNDIIKKNKNQNHHKNKSKDKNNNDNDDNNDNEDSGSELFGSIVKDETHTPLETPTINDTPGINYQNENNTIKNEGGNEELHVILDEAEMAPHIEYNKDKKLKQQQQQQQNEDNNDDEREDSHSELYEKGDHPIITMDYNGYNTTDGATINNNNNNKTVVHIGKTIKMFDVTGNILNTNPLFLKHIESQLVATHKQLKLQNQSILSVYSEGP